MRGGLLSQFERIPGDVGERNDLVTLVVVPEDEELLSEYPACHPSSLDEVGVGGGGQIARALHPAFTPRVGVAAQEEQGKWGKLRFGRHVTYCRVGMACVQARSPDSALRERLGVRNAGYWSSCVHCEADDSLEATMSADVSTSSLSTEADGIVLTDAAAVKVKALLDAEGRDDLTLRVAVQPGGCSGLRYQLFFDDRNLDGDVQKDFGGVAVVTDRMSAPYLNGATIDFVDTIEKQGFTIDNPNASGSCACGDSFS